MIKDITRIDEMKMHKAVREVLCNAISNSDFYQPQGIVIKKYKEKIEFSNFGYLRMSEERMGESSARNKTILKMFNLVGVGERAGSGFPLIVSACKEFGFDKPNIVETYNPDRTKLAIFSVNKIVTKLNTKHNINDTIYSLNEKKIITFLSITDKVKAKDIALAVGLSLSTVKEI